MWPYTETAFPGTINAYQAAFATVTPPAGTIRFSSNEKNQEMIWWAREGNSPEGNLIQRYFITDEWGNRYIMGTTGVENDADIATSFNSTVLPQGWTKATGNLAENLILAPAYGAGDQAHFNLFRESADNAFFQFEWGVNGSSVAAQIAGMPIWGGPASDAILGRVGDDNLIHGAEGDDVISALGNNDDIYGDIGTDTVALQGRLSDYQVMEWAEQGAQLRLSGFGVTKSLYDTEFLRFSDGSMIATSAVPEPSTYAMALAGLAYGGYSMWSRRKRA
jgi:Ca2+-binding RTX toxin-like protein